MAKKGGKPDSKMDPLEIPEKRNLSSSEQEELLHTLQQRFEENSTRHLDIDWQAVQSRLTKNTDAMWSVYLMESTGGEPDVIGYDQDNDQYLISDCSEQSPEDRRKITYDEKGLAIRQKKGVFPPGSAVGVAQAMGVELLDEELYRHLQTVGEFDTKTSSWIKTPDKIRKLGGALFCDRRYDTVFVYHNSAESFYSARGFRGLVRV